MVTRETELVRALLDSDWRLSLVVAGGGGSVVDALLAQPGASHFVRSVIVPYSNHAMRSFLCTDPTSSVSQEVGVRLAEQALERVGGASLAKPWLGVGLTAALATERERKGEDQFFVSIVSLNRRLQLHGVFEKGRLRRDQQESVLRQCVLNLMADCCGVPRMEAASVAGFCIVAEEQGHCSSDPIAGLVEEELDYVVIDADGRRTRNKGLQQPVLLSGSFHPLHAGHTHLAEAVERLLRRDVFFELSIRNADKPSLTFDDVRSRLRQMAWSRPIVVTRVPRFLDKARLFPGCTFVVGYDTVVRLLQATYYGGHAQLVEALTEIRGYKGTFLVAGRQQDGVYRSLADVELPNGFGEMFKELPESVFRSDLCSTNIRADD